MSTRPTLNRGDIVRTLGCRNVSGEWSIDDLLVTSPPDPSGLVMLAARSSEGVFDAGSPYLARVDELRLVRGPTAQTPHAAHARQGFSRRELEGFSASRVPHTTIIPEGFTRLEREGIGALVDALESSSAGEYWTREDLETLASETLLQIALLIRRGDPIVLPDLGTFFRAPKTGTHGAFTVRFVPSPDLLAGGRVDA